MPSRSALEHELYAHFHSRDMILTVQHRTRGCLRRPTSGSHARRKIFVARAERLGTWPVDIIDLSGAIGDLIVARRRIAGGPQTGPHYDTTRVKGYSGCFLKTAYPRVCGMTGETEGPSKQVHRALDRYVDKCMAHLAGPKVRMQRRR